jgi:hypothetical protein
LADLQIAVTGTPVNIPVASSSVLEPDSRDESSASACGGAHGCVGAPSDTHSRASFGCPQQRINFQFYDLCTGSEDDGVYEPGYLSAYVHQYVYTAVDGGFPVVDQNHIEAPENGTPCPNGGSGRRRAVINRAGTSISALDGKLADLVAGTYRDDHRPGEPVDVRIGSVTGPDQSSSVDGANQATPHFHDTSLTYQIDNWYTLNPRTEGSYSVVLGAKDDRDGTRVPDPSSVVNVWVSDTATSARGDLQLATGTHFPSLLNTYAVQSVLAFSFSLEGC